MKIKICNICGSTDSGKKYTCSHVTLDNYAPYTLEIDQNSLGQVIADKTDKLKVNHPPSLFLSYGAQKFNSRVV